MDPSSISKFDVEWYSIRICIRYEASWLKMPDYDVAHIQVESLEPRRAPLPISETGYRSHFTSPAVIEDHGGPVAFVQAWLDAEAQSPPWKQAEAEQRQLSLF